MTKKSKIAKNEQRRKLVARCAERRAGLKEIIGRPSSTLGEHKFGLSRVRVRELTHRGKLPGISKASW
jgi:small subunit ribosomal protein S14